LSSNFEIEVELSLVHEAEAVKSLAVGEWGRVFVYY
jgi:hypothetical protein